MDNLILSTLTTSLVEEMPLMTGLLAARGCVVSFGVFPADVGMAVMVTWGISEFPLVVVVMTVVSAGLEVAQGVVGVSSLFSMRILLCRSVEELKVG